MEGVVGGEDTTGEETGVDIVDSGSEEGSGDPSSEMPEWLQ